MFHSNYFRDHWQRQKWEHPQKQRQMKNDECFTSHHIHLEAIAPQLARCWRLELSNGMNDDKCLHIMIIQRGGNELKTWDQQLWPQTVSTAGKPSNTVPICGASRGNQKTKKATHSLRATHERQRLGVYTGVFLRGSTDGACLGERKKCIFIREEHLHGARFGHHHRGLVKMRTCAAFLARG